MLKMKTFLAFRLSDVVFIMLLTVKMPITVSILTFCVNDILFKYKVHRDTTDTSYIQYNTFERDTEISLRLV